MSKVNIKKTGYYGCADSVTDANKCKRYAKQRKKRGFDDTETWSLDGTIADFVYPRLKRLKKLNTGYPSTLKSIKEWENILDKMILAFKHLRDDNICNSIESERKRQEEIAEGLKLFAKYFQHLWW